MQNVHQWDINDEQFKEHFQLKNTLIKYLRGLIETRKIENVIIIATDEKGLPTQAIIITEIKK
jgi:hypothetical protein